MDHDDSGRTDGDSERTARRTARGPSVGGRGDVRGVAHAGGSGRGVDRVTSRARGDTGRVSRTAGRDGVSHAGTSGPYRDGALTLTEGAGLREEAGEHLAAINRAYGGLIDKIGALARGGVVEHLDGMTLDRFLSVAHRVTGSDVWLLETAARVLEAMPVTSTWFRAGVVSWSQLRRIVTGARDLSAEHREIMDRRIAASGHLLEGAGAEAFLDAVDVAVDEVHGRAAIERREQREARNSFLTQLIVHVPLERITATEAGLALLGRPPHRRRETHGWTAHLDHHTGAMVRRRAGRTWVSWPWGTPLADPGPDPDHHDGGEGRDPPIPFQGTAGRYPGPVPERS